MDLAKANEYAKKMIECRWVKWVHPGTQPANTPAEKKENAEEVAKTTNHCGVCLNLNGCCFVENNSPRYPHHRNCHCYLIRIEEVEVKVDSSIKKYTDYLFQNENKKVLFSIWGYTEQDSLYLKEEFEKQAYLAYKSGEYRLGLLNEYGQRMNIVIHLIRKDNGKEVTFVSGWMVYPNGRLVLITPYGDE